MGENDTWQAAVALRFDLTIVTDDTDFEKVPSAQRRISPQARWYSAEGLALATPRSFKGSFLVADSGRRKHRGEILRVAQPANLPFGNALVPHTRNRNENVASDEPVDGRPGDTEESGGFGYSPTPGKRLSFGVFAHGLFKRELSFPPQHAPIQLCKGLPYQRQRSCLEYGVRFVQLGERGSCHIETLRSHDHP